MRLKVITDLPEFITSSLSSRQTLQTPGRVSVGVRTNGMLINTFRCQEDGDTEDEDEGEREEAEEDGSR